jgi:hypothetical protein
MARFYIGQPVVCVDGRVRPHVDRRYPGLRWPRRGVRYTIRENIDIDSHGDWITFVTVDEIQNRKIRWPGGRKHEAGFHEDRFEPATDISDLEKVSKTVGLFMGNDGPVEKRRRKVPQRKKEDA